MLICRWEDCKLAFEEFAGFQEHVITKHIQPQQMQLNLDNQQNDVGIKEGEDDHGGPIAKKAKMNEEEESKIIKKGGQIKIIFLAVEVWVDVLGFIRRIQLARSVCLVNFKIYEICWPRLHGNKVMAHEVREIVIVEYDYPPTAVLLLKDNKKVPFPECLPPAYISGFERIRIKFLDHQVLAFLSLIAPRIMTNNVRIHFTVEMSYLDENQVASVNQLLQICREKITSMPSILVFNRGLFSSIPFLPDVDNKIKRIDCYGVEELDIPILMPFLASPRADGQQRVMHMYIRNDQLPVVPKLLDAIKEEFRTSPQLMPQPFCIRIKADSFDIPPSGEENPKTNETLTIMPRGNGYFDICRHPRGQYEQWAEDARKRIELPLGNLNTTINVDISEFGMPYCSP